GPFTVMEKMSDMNYFLKLQPKYKIHPVFHIELLTTYTLSKLLPCNEPVRPPPEIENDNGSEWLVEC
ncbi:hypothetical protein BDR04DRAFT_1035998, partial [Suillus decipiens]